MSEVLTVPSASPEDTQRLAACLVPLLVPGDVVLISGELGAGKTAFVQGLARAAGVTEAVTSPTFILLRSYPTTIGLDLLHVDVYRLAAPADIADLGLSELLEEQSCAVIEWGERAVSVIGPHYLHVGITVDPPAPGFEVPGRRLTMAANGPSWLARWPALLAILGERTGGAPIVTQAGAPA